MEGAILDHERIGNKRRERDEVGGNIGRLEKRPSGMVVIDDYSGDEMINGVKYEEEKNSPVSGGGGGGLFNQLFTNLVNSPRSNQQVESGGGGFEGETEKINGDSGDVHGGAGGGEDGDGEKGGVINNLISNIFSSNGGAEEVEKDDGGGGSGGGEVLVEKDDGGDGGGGEDEKDDGGSIIDNIVAKLPRTLSEDTPAPATDEASILLHSIIHD